METQIVAALHVGFSLAEIRGLTVGEVLLFCDLATPKYDDGKKTKGTKRKATQADIDRFLK